MGMRVEYGLYFSSTKLFGVYAQTWSGGSQGGPVAGLIEGELMPVLTPEQSTTVISELERAKQYELAKDQVRRIELKKPGLWGMWLGRARTKPVEGPSIRYTLRTVIAYHRLVQLTPAF